MFQPGLSPCPDKIIAHHHKILINKTRGLLLRLYDLNKLVTSDSSVYSMDYLVNKQFSLTVNKHAKCLCNGNTCMYDLSMMGTKNNGINNY